MKLDLLAALNEERRARRAAIVFTELDSGAQTLVREAEIDGDADPDQCRDLIRAGRSRIVERAGARAFATVLVPPARLVVVGAVHVSQAMAPMARTLGYDMTIVDPRTAFASAARFPDTEIVAEWPDEALPRLGVDRWTAFCALTHDPKIDDPGLTHALESDCFYIGALGSRKTHGKRVERLSQAGLSDLAIARIHAPIGLDIGAQSPAEIALSILAEITGVLRGKPAP